MCQYVILPLHKKRDHDSQRGRFLLIQSKSHINKLYHSSPEQTNSKQLALMTLYQNACIK